MMPENTKSDSAPVKAVGSEALRLLAAEDARQEKLHELLETIREQIRLGVEPEHRPDGLFQNIQDAVYAMRGRTPLMNDVAITAALAHPGSGDAEPGAWRSALHLAREYISQDHGGYKEGDGYWEQTRDLLAEINSALATPQAPAQTLQHHTGDGEGKSDNGRLS